MPDYRLYVLSPENRIKSATDIHAPSDEAAVAEAQAAECGDWELWSGRRLVNRAQGANGNSDSADDKA